MKGSILNSIKQSVTILGSALPEGTLRSCEAVMGYLRIGRWMGRHGFRVSSRCSSRQEVWEQILQHISDKRILYLEFGVASGASISYWSQRLKHSESILHGFDSFEGLPEEGGRWKKGDFGVNGRIPEIPDSRVQFFKGWFDETLPKYTVPPHQQLVLNMDADLYSSTSCVLDALRPWIKQGTLIYFDDFFQVDHEPRAFEEFMAKTKLRFKLRAADQTFKYAFFECLGE